MFRYSPVIVGLIVAVFGVLMIITPTLFLYWAVAALLALTLFLWRMIRRAGSRAVTLGMGGATMLFVMAGFAVLLFIEETLFQYGLVVCLVGACGFITQNIYAFVYEPERYHPYALESVFSYVNVVTIFFTLAALHTVMFLFSYPVWPFVPVVAVLGALVSYQTFWAYKVKARDAVAYAVPVSIMTVEVFTAVSFLPAPPLALAALTSIMYYLFMNVLREHIAQRLELKTIRVYLTVSALLVAAVILSSPWR